MLADVKYALRRFNNQSPASSWRFAGD